MTCGVPQGSVLGPLLWNVMYDELLEVNLGGNVRGESSSFLVAFADDVAVVATGRTSSVLQTVTNKALDVIAKWMDNMGLTLSVNKTEAVILTTKRGYDNPHFILRGVQIAIQDHIRYLGVELHRVLGFKAHIETAVAKATKTSLALARLMPNMGGSSQRKRRLLATVVESQLLYAAPIWASALVFERNVKTLQRPQRTIALRVAMAYRTVSTQAILVVAGIVPAHLLALERQLRYERRFEANKTIVQKEIQDEVYRRWQAEWDAADTGRWTQRLIGDIKKWTNRTFGMVNFHLTQMLTGHGCFSQYLHRFKKLADPRCVDCQAPTDDAEHAIFCCDRWWRERRSLEVEIGGEFKADTVVEMMLGCATKWETIRIFVEKILSSREEEERNRQKNES